MSCLRHAFNNILLANGGADYLATEQEFLDAAGRLDDVEAGVGEIADQDRNRENAGYNIQTVAEWLDTYLQCVRTISKRCFLSSMLI